MLKDIVNRIKIRNHFSTSLLTLAYREFQNEQKRTY